MTLEGKIALVTGAGRGVGRGIAERLVSDGATVIVNYSRSAAGADEIVTGIQHAGGTALAVCADVSDLEQIAAMFETVRSQYPALDILGNNAGRGSNGMPTLATCTPEEPDFMFSVNTRGLYFVAQEALRMMNDGGTIVNISSLSASARVPGISAYAGSKAAIDAFTRIWAAKLAPRRITVNSVVPGMTNTDLITDNMPADMAEKLAHSVPLGRIGEPEDIAGAVSFLCSDDARWITGQQIAVTGGT